MQEKGMKKQRQEPMREKEDQDSIHHKPFSFELQRYAVTGYQKIILTA
jgi:hypothetical protein